MKFKNSAIEELRQIYEQETGVAISAEEARGLANDLCAIYSKLAEQQSTKEKGV